MDTAFAFLKVLVQTRAKSHTAIGAVCYRFGLGATSTLETPVREGPSEAELKAFEATEKRRLAEARKKGKKAQRRRLRAKLLRMDPPRHYDYRGRVGIAASGAALPEGAAPEWSGPLEWGRRVEAVDGKRLDSRQCRDDVVGIPIELVESGFADLAIARQAAKLAELHQTPVHWVIHKPHGAGLNWHAHMLYAGRRLSPDGHGFEQLRDTAQDRPELIEDHKRLWAETCREFGVEITFALPGQAIEDEVREEFTAEHGRSPTDDDEPAIQLEKRKRWQEHREATTPQHTVTSKALRVERDAVAEEEGLRLDAILQAAGGAFLTPHDRRELGRLSSGVEDLDTAQLLALDRVPVTTTARIAKYGRPTPAPSPVRQVEPPRPSGAPAIEAPLVPAHALPEPQPAAAVRAMASVELLSRAGLRARVPVAPQRIMRPRWPVPRVEEALVAAPAQDERPTAAPALVHPAPEPPWRRLIRRLRQAVTEWWPWAPTPPRPHHRVKLRLPKPLRRPARPVPARRSWLEAPTGLARPMSARRPILLQHPDIYDFDPVTRTVTRNTQFREREARARARTQAAHWPQETPPDDRPRPKRGGGYDDGIGY